MKGIEHIADKQTDQKIEERHEAEGRKRILQRVDEVLDLPVLTTKHPYDMIVEVYCLARSDEHEAQEDAEWSDFER